ncbi:MAG: hypothetical protein K2O10_00230, partial [Muribaculaceae bacterium]|nr:hypothetical protein [Muribaculaceae bacterium]
MPLLPPGKHLDSTYHTQKRGKTPKQIPAHSTQKIENNQKQGLDSIHLKKNAAKKAHPCPKLQKNSGQNTPHSKKIVT